MASATALFNQRGRICSVLGKQFIFAIVDGPTLISFGRDPLPEQISICDGNLTKFSSFVVYQDGRPLPCENFYDGCLVFFDAYKLDQLGYVAVLIWKDYKPFYIPLCIGDFYIISEVLENVPIIHIDKKCGSLTFKDKDILRKAVIEINDDANFILDYYDATKFQGTICVFNQRDHRQHLHYVCSLLKLTRNISYTPVTKYAPSKLYKYTEKGIEETSSGSYVHSNIPGDIIYRLDTHWLNFSFKSKDFRIPLEPNMPDISDKFLRYQEVFLHIFEEMQEDNFSLLKVTLISVPGINWAFLVEVPFEDCRAFSEDDSSKPDSLAIKESPDPLKECRSQENQISFYENFSGIDSLCGDTEKERQAHNCKSTNDPEMKTPKISEEGSDLLVASSMSHPNLKQKCDSSTNKLNSPNIENLFESIQNTLQVDCRLHENEEETITDPLPMDSIRDGEAALSDFLSRPAKKIPKILTDSYHSTTSNSLRSLFPESINSTKDLSLDSQNLALKPHYSVAIIDSSTGCLNRFACTNGKKPLVVDDRDSDTDLMIPNFLKNDKKKLNFANEK